jgi:glycosyltransferase involved in cell wall biosynthesis
MLLSVAAADRGPSVDMSAGYRDVRFEWSYAHTPVLRAMRYSSGLAVALSRVVPDGHLVHSHGLWLLPNIQAARAAARAGRPFIVSPRGMLSPAALAYSRLKKQAFWQLLQAPAIVRAACLHATSRQEYEEIRAFGLTNPVAVVPNGVDLPEPDVPATLRRTTDRTVLSLGRLHPKKALDRLLRAWARVEPAHPDWRLRIVGPAEHKHDEELRALASALGLARATIEGAVYGEAKAAAYRGADLFVLPSLNENFGVAVAEALASGVPVIATKGTPWASLEAEGCGWWIDHGAESLAAALNRAMALPPTVLTTMGTKGREWMARDFSWDRAARDMLAVYRWMALGGPRPSVVESD